MHVNPVTSCENVTSHGNAMSHISSGISMSPLMEIIISTGILGILHTKYYVLPHLSLHVETKL